MYLVLMEFLLDYLPKDLVNIVEDYAKDRTNYDKVIDELERRTIDCIWITGWQNGSYGKPCHRLDVYGTLGVPTCCCKRGANYRRLKKSPECFELHCQFLESFNNDKNLSRIYRKNVFSYLECDLRRMDLFDYEHLWINDEFDNLREQREKE